MIADIFITYHVSVLLNICVSIMYIIYSNYYN